MEHMETQIKKNRKLGIRGGFAIWFSAMMIGTVVLFSACCYHLVKTAVFKFYSEKARDVVLLAASMVDGDEAMRFLEQRRVDESFQQRDQLLKQMKKEFDLYYLYLYKPETDRQVYIYAACNPGDAPYSRVATGDAETYSDSNAKIVQEIVRTGKPYFGLDINYSEKYGSTASVYAPVFNASGEVKAIFAADYQMDPILTEIRTKAILTTVSAVAIVLALMGAYLGVVDRQIVAPLKRLTASAARFVAQMRRDPEKNAEITFDAVEIKQDNELKDLADAYSCMACDLNAYIRNLKRITAAKQAIETELAVAKNIQEMLLPQIFPPFTESDRFTIYATIEPAKSVGGDYYDFYLIDEDHLCVAIADVSGKGVPAALFMVIAKTIMKNHALANRFPDEILYRANNQLNEDNGEGMFVTAFLGILQISTGTFRYANAGHNPPLLCRRGGVYEFLPVEKNIVLAVADDMEFTSQEIDLQPGDTLFMYTDGVTEAMNTQNEQYKEERLVRALNVSPDKTPPRALLAEVRASVAAHVGAAEQSDDITMMALRLDEA